MTRLVNNSINSLVQVVDSNGDKVTDAVVNYKVYFYDYDDTETWIVAESGLMNHIGDGLYQAEWTPAFIGEYTFYAYSTNPKFHEAYTYYVEDTLTKISLRQSLDRDTDPQDCPFTGNPIVKAILIEGVQLVSASGGPCRVSLTGSNGLHVEVSLPTNGDMATTDCGGGVVTIPGNFDFGTSITAQLNMALQNGVIAVTFVYVGGQFTND